MGKTPAYIYKALTVYPVTRQEPEHKFKQNVRFLFKSALAKFTCRLIEFTDQGELKLKESLGSLVRHGHVYA